MLITCDDRVRLQCGFSLGGWQSQITLWVFFGVMVESDYIVGFLWDDDRVRLHCGFSLGYSVCCLPPPHLLLTAWFVCTFKVSKLLFTQLQKEIKVLSCNCKCKEQGGVVAQLVERQPRDPMDSMTRGLNPVRSTRKICECFSESICCADSLCITKTLHTGKNKKTG